MYRIRNSGGILLVLLLLINFQPAQAASGLPNSPQFGYGAWLDLSNSPTRAEISWQLQAAALARLDWIAINLDWAAVSPTQSEPNLGNLDPVLSLAAEYGLHVLISLTHAPSWSLNVTGPDPSATASLVVKLAKRYPGTLLAVELFAAANTIEGWGASPNPATYLQLLKTTQTAIQANRLDIALIAGGLTPLIAHPAPGDIDDLAFLSGLYQAGGTQAIMPIISMRLPGLAGDPMADSALAGRQYLRRFEAIRQIMLDNGHERGLIWITGFSWPGEIDTSEAQANWLVEAYSLLQSHLYMGAGFFNNLTAPNDVPSLIRSEGSYHPALSQLSQLIATRRAASSDSAESDRRKKIILRPDFKHFP